MFAQAALINDRLSHHLPYNAASNVGRGLAPAEQVRYLIGCVRRGYAKPLVRRRGQAPALRWVQHCMVDAALNDHLSEKFPVLFLQ